ncbi:class I SAM-dependent methyltransferase [Sessilibacter corallicola]|uniref:class I SAM-dependent methyltransferase n=1 Tax=Sessilibacter corallicola TaxID=2904075 RepID=UPI001E450851|nr:methyltransferase domain-containing protein [Sessilibacter corallicola]MCE2027497.1 class I SAM-dependent methyltransferase [Sessilibacter corallicola]
MSSWHNQSGRPLSSIAWLKTHHLAKLRERRNFAKEVVERDTKIILDLGCGPGLWLGLFDEIAPKNCKLIGVDSDQSTISAAKCEAKGWSHKYDFKNLDIVKDINDLPEADILLAFNIFPYLSDPLSFINKLKIKVRPGGKVVVRQYDGAAMRFGPMPHDDRIDIDISLYSAVGKSNQFHHYDLDRMFKLLQKTNFNNVQLDFELFKRTSPYAKEFLEYYKNTISWTCNYTNEIAAHKLRLWEDEYLNNHENCQSYFTEVDLVSVLS